MANSVCSPNSAPVRMGCTGEPGEQDRAPQVVLILLFWSPFLLLASSSKHQADLFTLWRNKKQETQQRLWEKQLLDGLVDKIAPFRYSRQLLFIVF